MDTYMTPALKRELEYAETSINSTIGLRFREVEALERIATALELSAAER